LYDAKMQAADQRRENLRPVRQRYRPLIDRALELDPKLGAAYFARAMWGDYPRDASATSDNPLMVARERDFRQGEIDVLPRWITVDLYGHACLRGSREHLRPWRAYAGPVAGEPAARLSEVDLAPEEAQPLFDQLMRRIPPEHGVTFSSVDQTIQNLVLVIAPNVGGVLALAIGIRGAPVALAIVGFLAFVLFLLAPLASILVKSVQDKAGAFVGTMASSHPASTARTSAARTRALVNPRPPASIVP